MSTLKGSSVPLPKLIYSSISPLLQQNSSFEKLQTYYPGMGIVCDLKNPPESDVWLDHKERVRNAKHYNPKLSDLVDLQIEKNVEQQNIEIQDISGFCKVTHLLDPVLWMQGKYGDLDMKINDPMNQAYVEALASYLFGKLRENEVTPHFHKFYGAFKCINATYAYNITDSILSYRKKRWFWDAKEKKVFTIGFDDEDIPEEIQNAVNEKPENLYESDSEDSEVELEELDKNDENAENVSLHSASMDDLETVKDDEDEDEDEEDEDEDDEDDEEEELNIYAEIHKFPTMLIYTESSEGTMDDLLEDFDEVGARPGTYAWETRWKAWIFQVIAALSVAQTIFGFTHNDLHSNNIVWTKTDKPYIYYSCQDGLHFKVPTFGKLFRIIDFGRSIFTVNGKLFFSDDFRPGNDAAEQFNFGEIYDPNEEEVLPNPSFDLSRFTVSVFEAIFPSSPTLKKKGSVLSQENGLKMMETVSPLYNVMWTWLLCDDGHNVLMDPDGKERYPDFDLYKVISAQVHNAVPSQQIKKALFEDFRVKKKTIPEGTKVYSLFC